MYYEYDYPSLCFILNMKTLETRRSIMDISFLNKLMQDKVNCPYLVNQISLCVPQPLDSKKYRPAPRKASGLSSISHKPTFAIKYRLLCRKNCFMLRVMDMANRSDLYNDLVMKSPTVFKDYIKSVF